MEIVHVLRAYISFSYKHTFRSSIFYLFILTPLIVNVMNGWKIAFLVRLSSARIFHLPPEY
ncbi:hypothetical protein BWP07_06625 [Bacteroides fragilis]|nr:hypothetical protein BWP07_06625 [Bacteroides fragilis]